MDDSSTEQKPSGGLARLAIFATVCIDLLGFAIVLPLLPRYADYYQADGITLGLLMASFSAMQFVGAPIWGRFSDRIGRRPVLILGLFGSTFSYLAFGLVSRMQPNDLWLGMGPIAWLFVTRIAAGMAGATIPTAQAYIADTTDQKNRGKGMALIGAAFGVGFTFGPLLGAAWVSDDVSAPPSAMPGFVASVLSLIAAVFAIIVLKESTTSDSRNSAFRVTGMSTLLNALSNGTVFLILIAIFMTTFAFAQFESTLSLLTSTMGVSDRKNFLLFAYIGFVLALSQGGLVRPLLSRVNEFYMSLAGVLLMTIGLWLISVAGQQKSVALLYVVLPVSVVGFSAVTPSLQALLSLRVSSSQQGEILGVGQSISALARILGPAVGLAIFDKQNVEYPYWMGAGIMGLAFFLLLMLVKKQQQSFDSPQNQSESDAVLQSPSHGS